MLRAQCSGEKIDDVDPNSIAASMGISLLAGRMKLPEQSSERSQNAAVESLEVAGNARLLK
jgi:hypothetical protein